MNKKETRGRKNVHPLEKKERIAVFVKKGGYQNAKKECEEIARKVNSISYQKEAGAARLVGS